MTTYELPPDLEAALAGVASVGVITGAGISAESGIPTYRGAGGIYDDPVEGDRTVEALTGATLHRDPDRTWRAVAALARHSIAARPNAAHEALVRIEDSVASFVLLTQNVDGLHTDAGTRSLIDIHGDVLATRCTRCDARGRLTRDDVVALEHTPACSCGGGLRPDAVLFGERLPQRKVFRMQEAFYRRTPDLVLVVGTSAMFPYIGEPVVHAAREGKLTVEVNPEPTELSPVVAYALREPAGVVLPRMAAVLEASRRPGLS